MKQNEYVKQMKTIIPSEELIEKTISKIEQVSDYRKIEKRNKWKKILINAAAITTLSVSSVGAYVAITGNTEILERLGIHIGQNHEKNKQEISNSDEYVELAEGVEANLQSVSLDNSSIVMEFNLKINKEIENLSPDLKIGKVEIYMPESQETISEEITISEKCSAEKMEDGTWKLFKYISLNNGALSGNSFWSDVFYTENEVECTVEFSGLYNDNEKITGFSNDNRIFKFSLEKPASLNNTEAVVQRDVIKYKNITVDEVNIQKSDFGNVIGFTAKESNIDMNKVNDIQKIDFVIKDSNGNEVNVVSRNDNITIEDYSKGKFHTIGLEVQLVVDDTSDNTDYTIEVIESDEIKVASDKIKTVYDEILKQSKSGEFVLTADGISLVRTSVKEDDYYLDEYGVYLSDKTSKELALGSGENVLTKDDDIVPMQIIVDKNDYYKGDDGYYHSDKTGQELYEKYEQSLN